MKCQIRFSGKNKKNIIYLSYAEIAQRVVKNKQNCMRIKDVCIHNIHRIQIILLNIG